MVPCGVLLLVYFLINFTDASSAKTKHVLKCCPLPNVIAESLGAIAAEIMMSTFDLTNALIDRDSSDSLIKSRWEGFRCLNLAMARENKTTSPKLIQRFKLRQVIRDVFIATSEYRGSGHKLIRFIKKARIPDGYAFLLDDINQFAEEPMKSWYLFEIACYMSAYPKYFDKVVPRSLRWVFFSWQQRLGLQNNQTGSYLTITSNGSLSFALSKEKGEKWTFWQNGGSEINIFEAKNPTFISPTFFDMYSSDRDCKYAITIPAKTEVEPPSPSAEDGIVLVFLTVNDDMTISINFNDNSHYSPRMSWCLAEDHQGQVKPVLLSSGECANWTLTREFVKKTGFKTKVH